MRKNKKILSIIFALVFSVVVTASLVACQPECKHKYGDWVNRNGDETFCENRLYFRTCENCGEEDWKEGAKSDHDFEVETVEPNCTKGGYDLSTCTICGKTETSNNTPACHDLNNEYLYNRQSHWQTCNNCDYVTGQSEHNFNNNDICTVCGLQNTTAGFLFTDMGDYYEVTGYEGNEKNVIIPSEYSGKPVKSIGEYAFGGCLSLESINIPDSVTNIGNNAFRVCANLESISIPNSVTNIGEYAFYGCESLTSIDIPEGITSIGNYAFTNCLRLKSIDIPEGVTSIGNYAFSNCVRLESIDIPEGVTSIGNFMFSNCKNIESIIIPESVTSIGRYAFADCISLEIVYYGGSESEWNSIQLDSDNEPLTSATVYYYSESEPTEYGNYWHYGEDGQVEIWEQRASQGLLFELNADGVSYAVVGIGECGDTEIVIPDFYSDMPVTVIGEYAFSENEDITHVTIPDSVKKIQTAAFASCPALESVTVGKGVTDILPGAFADCPSLTEITVNKGNADFKSIDGNVYSKDGRTLVQYAMGKTDSTFVIPSEVKTINVGAFAHSPHLTKMVIPDTVERIHIAAFYHCESLVSVVIGKSVEYIHEFAFNDCSKLAFVCYAGTESEWTSIAIHGDNNYIHFATVYYYSERDPMVSGNYWHYDEGGEVEIWQYAPVSGLKYRLNPSGVSYSVIGIGDFEDTELIVPSIYNGWPVTNIGESAFAENDTITHVIIPDSVKSIEATAFASCKLLRSVTIGKGVESIGFGAFADCPSLTEITVNANNAAYKHIDGNLYTKDGKALVQYAAGKTDSTFVIPNHVEEICVGAFAHSPYLTTVIIPESVKKIGISAFYNCDNLESIVISQSVEYIGFSAFDDCDKLNYVYYAGTESEWTSIVIHGDNNYIHFVTVYYYSESEPTEDGNYWHYDEDGEAVVW